jgi:hypothetical protein
VHVPHVLTPSAGQNLGDSNLSVASFTSRVEWAVIRVLGILYFESE